MEQEALRALAILALLVLMARAFYELGRLNPNDDD